MTKRKKVLLNIKNIYIMDKVHPGYSLCSTVTGRTASKNPNSQQIPKRGPLAKQYRKILYLEMAIYFLELDMSQLELRIRAWMANEKNMIKIYNEGKDIYKVAASAAHFIEELLEKFGLLPKELQKDLRQKAKGVNTKFNFTI